MRLTLALDSWSRRDRRYTAALIAEIVSALARVDRLWLAAHPTAPAIYRSGVEYRREPRGVEEWQDIPSILARGHGDCEDLSAWRIAELRRLGLDARPVIDAHPRADGGTTYHVRLAVDGTAEDPSLVLLGRARPTLPLP